MLGMAPHPGGIPPTASATGIVSGMPKARTTNELRRDDHVLAAIDLPGVPAGTHGRVKLVNGFAWKRYWVSFDNGLDHGSLDRAKLTLVTRKGEPIPVA